MLLRPPDLEVSAQCGDESSQMKDILDIAIHTAAALAIGALLWLLGTHVGPQWSAALAAGLVFAMREKTQIEAGLDTTDFLKGWGDWTAQKILEWAVPLAVCLAGAALL